MPALAQRLANVKVSASAAMTARARSTMPASASRMRSASAGHASDDGEPGGSGRLRRISPIAVAALSASACSSSVGGCSA